MNLNEGVRILEVIMALSLLWDKQFLAMKDRMRIVIAKLKNTIIPTLLTYIFFNAYLIKSIYFGYGVISITRK